MRKQSIFIVSFILTVFSMLLLLQNLEANQQNFPFGSTVRFELNTSQTSKVKTDLISELNEIAINNQSIIVKPMANVENYSEIKDIIVFGDYHYGEQNIILENNVINWLDSTMTGSIIMSTNMNTRSLNGFYSVLEKGNIVRDINKWAEQNDINISWLKNPSFFKTCYSMLFQTGIGNTIIALVLLLIITFFSWIITHAKNRAVRLCAGINDFRICIEDTVVIMQFVIRGILIGWLSVIVYIALINSIKQIQLYLFPSLVLAGIIILIITIIVYAISFFIRPRVKHLAERTIPLKEIKILSWIVKIIVIVVALVVVPSTMTAGYVYSQLSNEYALWEKYNNYVMLSISDIDTLESDHMLPKVEAFFKEMEDEGILQISYVIDDGIELSNEELGGYDHLVLVDKSWISSSNVGIETDASGGRLNEISLEMLSPQLSEFINLQFPLWLNSENPNDAGIHYYEYVGKSFLAMSPKGQTIQAKNPLVVLVDSPSVMLKVKGFTIYAASSGNVLFTNKEKLMNCLDKYQITPFILSVDNISDSAMELAQQFEKDAIYRILSCVAIIIAVSTIGIISARMWITENYKRIFILRSNGEKYRTIIQTILKKEIFITLTAISTGTIVSIILGDSNKFVLLLSFILITCIYFIGDFISYYLCMRNSFRNTCHRNY